MTSRGLVKAGLVLAAASAALLPMDAWTVERWFSTGIYPRLQRVLTPLSDALPVAWLDLASVGALGWLVWLWWRAIRRAGEGVAVRLGRAALTTLSAAALAYLLFVGLWGLNYRRVPMIERLTIDREAPSTDDVLSLGREVVERLNAGHERAHQRGWSEPPWRNPTLRDAFEDAQKQLADTVPAVPGRLKQTLYGPFFRWTAVDGMVNPFGLEILANPDLLPFERPFVAAHEWAHLAGYADESEANFVGWLTCVHADAASQYSGWLYLYWQLAGELPEQERRVVARELGDGPRADLAAIVARLRRGDLPVLRRASWMVYDSYLKANRVEAGVRSYGAVVSLILRARFEDGWRPVRRNQVPLSP